MGPAALPITMPSTSSAPIPYSSASAELSSPSASISIRWIGVSVTEAIPRATGRAGYPSPPGLRGTRMSLPCSRRLSPFLLSIIEPPTYSRATWFEFDLPLTTQVDDEGGALLQGDLEPSEPRIDLYAHRPAPISKPVVPAPPAWSGLGRYPYAICALGIESTRSEDRELP